MATANQAAAMVRRCIVLALLLLGAATAQDFGGRFSDGDLELFLEATGGTYQGTIVFQGRTYPLTATANGTLLTGRFSAGEQSFPFSAELAGDQLTLETGGARYLLQRRAPPAQPTAPLQGAPPQQGDGVELEAMRQYPAGTRVRSTALGVSFVVPEGFTGAVGNQSSFAMTAPGRQALLLALPQAGATPEDMLAYLNGPQDLGNNLVGVPLGPAHREGMVVRQRFQARTQLGTFLGQAASLHGEAGNGVIFIAFGPMAEEAAYAAVLETLLAGVRLGTPQALAGVREWEEGLRGRKLYLLDYRSSSVLPPSQQSSFSREETWHLCSDGSYGYVLGTESYVGPVGATTPGGSQAAGRWKVIMLGNLPMLALTTEAGAWEGHALGFDGRNLYLDGLQVSVSPSEACR